MALKKPKPATYADLEGLPPNVVGEIIFGARRVQPRPAFRHGRAVARLQTKLGGPFDLDHQGPGGWVFVTEPELHLGNHVVVPDIGGWRRESMAQLPTANWTDIPPDWLCEILSPSTQRIDRTDKLAIYAEYGVKHCWYVDPIEKTLEVLALTGNKWLIDETCKDDDSVTAPPFETHTFPLDVLWPSDSA